MLPLLPKEVKKVGLDLYLSGESKLSKEHFIPLMRLVTWQTRVTQ